MVGQVPRGLRRGHLAPLVLDRLFLGQRVVNAGKELDVLAKGGGQRARAGFAPVVLQPVNFEALYAAGDEHGLGGLDHSGLFVELASRNAMQ